MSDGRQTCLGKLSYFHLGRDVDRTSIYLIPVPILGILYYTATIPILYLYCIDCIVVIGIYRRQKEYPPNDHKRVEVPT
jgi:hypothetical protein